MALRHYDPSPQALSYLEGCYQDFIKAVCGCRKDTSDSEAIKAFNRAWQMFEVTSINFQQSDSPDNARQLRRVMSKLADKAIPIAASGKEKERIAETYDSYNQAHESIYPFKEVPLKDRIYKPDGPPPSQSR